jgi:NIPSNAP
MRGSRWIHQLRIYEIFENTKAAFHARFRDHAARIMAKYEFDIVAMWEAKTPARTEFVYLLQWPDVATKTRAWNGFLADDEWKEIKRVTAAAHGRLVGAIEDRTLDMVDYSPRGTRGSRTPATVIPAERKAREPGPMYPSRSNRNTRIRGSRLTLARLAWPG